MHVRACSEENEQINKPPDMAFVSFVNLQVKRIYLI